MAMDALKLATTKLADIEEVKGNLPPSDRLSSRRHSIPAMIDEKSVREEEQDVFIIREEFKLSKRETKRRKKALNDEKESLQEKIRSKS